MKKVLIIVIVIFDVTCVEFLFAGDYQCTTTYDNNIFSANRFPMYGINFEFFRTKNLSVNYSFAIGNANDKINFHIPGGLALGFYGIYSVFHNISEREYSEDDEDEIQINPIDIGIIAVSVFSLIIPEGVNYYVPMSRYLSLGFYCHPLGYGNFDGVGALSSGIGMKFQYNLNDNLILVPQIGYNHYWGELPGQLNIGISFGFIDDLEK